MADDPLKAALDEIRARGYENGAHGAQAAHLSDAAAIDVPRLLSAVDAALKHHRPSPSYGRAFDAKGNPRCTHDPDGDHGEHYEDGWGEWYCTDLIGGWVCATCGEDDGCGLLPVAWPCAPYRDILAALTGKEATVTDEVRALTVRQPFASAIIFGGKDVENRGWGTRYRGRLLIHAGMGVDWKASAMAWTAAGLTPPPPAGRFDRSAWLASLPLGRIIGTVILASCHHESTEQPRLSCSPWGMPDQYHWDLIRARPLPEPVPCKGALSLWRLPENVEKAVREQLETGNA